MGGASSASMDDNGSLPQWMTMVGTVCSSDSLFRPLDPPIRWKWRLNPLLLQGMAAPVPLGDNSGDCSCCVDDGILGDQGMGLLPFIGECGPQTQCSVQILMSSHIVEMEAQRGE